MRASSPVSAAMAARLRSFAEPRLAPGGDLLAYATSAAGSGEILVVPAGGPAAVPVTSEPSITESVGHGGGLFCWTSDAGSLVFAAADGTLWRARRDGAAPERLVGPKLGTCAAPSVAGDHVVFAADDGRRCHVAVAPLDGSSWPVRLGSAGFCFDPDVRPDGAAVWHAWDAPDMPWDGGRILLRLPGGTPVSLDGEPGATSVAEPRFAPGGDWVAWLSDRSGFANVWTAAVDPPGERRNAAPVDADCAGPSWGPGNRSFAWSPDGRRIAFTVHREGRVAIHVADTQTGGHGELVPPTGVYAWLSWEGDGIAAVYSDMETPPHVRLIDPATGAYRVASPYGAGTFPPLGTARHVSWDAGGGRCQGILVRPPGAGETGPTPLLTWIHGGPAGQAQFAWNGRLHYFTSRGWSVLFVNHRGSTGYGRAYTQALRGRWGELDADDAASGAHHAMGQGWADPARLAVMGGSAGGFTVLNTLIRHPGLFAAGISLYGIADLFRLAETTHRFEAHSLETLVGPLPDAYPIYRDRSPLTHAGRIGAPLLVLQGGRDPVVPKGQAESIVAAVRASGTLVEYHEYPDEGHGWGDPAVTADELDRVDAFLRRHVLHVVGK